jgi:hypothetical protein
VRRLGDETQRESRYSDGAYQKGDTQGRPSASAVASVMKVFESTIDLAIARSSWGFFAPSILGSSRDLALGASFGGVGTSNGFIQGLT